MSNLILHFYLNVIPECVKNAETIVFSFGEIPFLKLMLLVSLPSLAKATDM